MFITVCTSVPVVFSSQCIVIVACVSVCVYLNSVCVFTNIHVLLSSSSVLCVCI